MTEVLTDEGILSQVTDHLPEEAISWTIDARSLQPVFAMSPPCDVLTVEHVPRVRSEFPV